MIEVKLFKSIISVIIVILLLGAIVYAVTPLKTIPGTVTIIVSPGIEVYSDPAMTQVLTSLDYGDMSSIETKQIVAFVKNTGDIPINVIYYSDISDGLLVFYPSNGFYLSLGSSGTLTIELHPAITEVFNVYISSEE
ncbi:hypothetical protein LCGC14_0420670 [marine sediment metagenome]|uniref:Uncharacterized protein n=1 Tax=marine sediment metagenome TaxID=412755 RepID=A0A0F9W096_9ZZZZ